MDWKLAVTAFSVIFIAEIGDKTQLAVFSMTAASSKPLSVFAGAIAALAIVTVLGVMVGGQVARWVPERVMNRIAAVLFVAIGIWTWLKE